MEEAPKIHISYAGGDPWSPAFKKVYKRVAYWHQVLKRHKGVATSNLEIKKLGRFLGTSAGERVDQAKAELQLACANNRRVAFKDSAAQHRLDHIAKLATAIATDNPKLQAAQVERRLRREKRQRIVGALSRKIRNKRQKVPVTFAQATDQQTGQTLDLTEQDEMVDAMADRKSVV